MHVLNFVSGMYMYDVRAQGAANTKGELFVGRMDSVDWNTGMEWWNGLDWTGLEWNERYCNSAR